jgi:hypothetical protein
MLIPVLRVANITNAAAWYARLGFGLEFEHSRGQAFSRADAILKRGEECLLLSQGDDRVKSDGVVCLRVAEIEPIANEFNVEIQHEFLRKQIELHDPDGNRIQVFALDSFKPDCSSTGSTS